MIGRGRRGDVIAEARRSVRPYARQLQEDEKLRRRLLAALAASFAAWERMQHLTRRRTAQQLVADPVLRRELHVTLRRLDEAQKRIQRARSHRLRNTLYILGGLGAVASVARSLRVRLWFLKLIRGQAHHTAAPGTQPQTAAPSPTGEPTGRVPEPTTNEPGF
jgi:hypothetical protein